MCWGFCVLDHSVLAEGRILSHFPDTWTRLHVQSQRGLPTNLVAGVGITAAVVMMAVLGFMAKPSTSGGSVAELIKRGQLRSDRGVEYVAVTIHSIHTIKLFSQSSKVLDCVCVYKNRKISPTVMSLCGAHSYIFPKAHVPIGRI